MVHCSKKYFLTLKNSRNWKENPFTNLQQSSCPALRTSLESEPTSLVGEIYPMEARHRHFAKLGDSNLTIVIATDV